MGLPPWETSDSQLFALVTGTNSGLGFAVCCRLIDEFLTSPSTPLTKHLVLIICTRTPMKTRFTISRLRGHLRKAAEGSPWAAKQRKLAKTQGNEYKWEDTVKRVHLLGVEVDFCDLKSVYRVADQLVNGTVGSPDATTMDGLKLPHGSPGTQSFSEDIKQDRWALSQTPGSIGAQRSWGWGLSGIRLPRLDAIILCAGMAGFERVSWAKAVWQTCTDMTQTLTFPDFMISYIGLLNKPQSSYKDQLKEDAVDEKQPLISEKEKDEPPLGQIFCANVFGSYILAHELMSLLSRPATPTSTVGGKIINVSSIEAIEEGWIIDDFQGLKSEHPYLGTKRVIDYLSLTAKLPGVKRTSAPFFDPSESVTTRKSKQAYTGPVVKPNIYLTHPGIFQSEIFPLPWFLIAAYSLCFIIIRLLGSPWHPTKAYKAAVAPVWMALLPAEEAEELDGYGATKAKWGSATDWKGEEMVMQTEVPGWGWTGRVESRVSRVGRKRGLAEVSKESREEFEVLGQRLWTKMEELRGVWEGVLGVWEGVGGK